MSIRFPLSFVALASFVTSLSCAAKLDSAPATQASADPSRFESQIGIVYAGEAHPDHLTPDQISRINDVASAAKPKGAHLWFVLVLLNERAKPTDRRRQLDVHRAVAYCIPFGPPVDENGKPVKVEDDELARLVDFARSALRAAGVTEPITTVMRDPNGDYTIDTGYERGSTIEIKKDAGGFRQVGRLGIWFF